MFWRKASRPDASRWDQTLEPVMKVVFGKKGIKTKNASEVGKKKVDYFRGRDLKKFLLESPALLRRRCSAALEEVLDGEVPQNDEDVEKIGAELLARGFCYKAVYKPLTASSADSGSEKKSEKKWPDRLSKAPNQRFEVDGFYVMLYESGTGLQHLFLTLIIFGVLLVCMFPVWPMWSKIGIWYLGVLFLTVYFGVILIRLAVFALFWVVGFDFWILPNLDDEYCGFIENFKPLYSWEKRWDQPLMLAMRLCTLLVFAIVVQQIAETHSFDDITDGIRDGYRDVLDWGVEKLLPPADVKQALPSVDELEKEAAAAFNSPDPLHGFDPSDDGPIEEQLLDKMQDPTETDDVVKDLDKVADNEACTQE